MFFFFFETKSLVAQAGLEFCCVAEADFELSSLASTFLGSQVVGITVGSIILGK